MSTRRPLRPRTRTPLRWPALLCVGASWSLGFAAAATSTSSDPRERLTEEPLSFGAFEARFEDASGSGEARFSIRAEGWPEFAGTWAIDAAGELVLTPLPASAGADAGDVAAACGDPARYRVKLEEQLVLMARVEDGCRPRTMILDHSRWRPRSQPEVVPDRTIRRTGEDLTRELPTSDPSLGHWPGFRGSGAAGVLDGAGLPDSWDVETGEGVLWRTEIPGLAHSSPAIWGDLVFVTTAVSSQGGASFRPGLYGDGDAAEDRSVHRFDLLALDRRSGEIAWRRTAVETAPREKRHIKSTYANATPVTDGRVVIAWFGSQGVHAFDVEGNARWSVDLGRLDLGAYDVPSYEWGTASSPTLWQGRVYLQVDTQTDSFLLALDASTGETLWKVDRDELPTWGTPTVIQSSGGAVELVSNGARWIRGNDPVTGEELWRLGRSSKITAPTPFLARTVAGSADSGSPGSSEELIVVTSGRAPERPIFAIRPGQKGDLTLAKGERSSGAVAWSWERRGSYMPTPVAYGGILYVLANNGVLDAYDVASGEELYRQRIDHGGSGFSASPVAADGRVYLPGEDGEVFVVRAGREFELLGRSSIHETLMASPALAPGMMLLRGRQHLTAIASP